MRSREFAGHFRAAVGSINCEFELLNIERLLEKIECAVLKNFKRNFRVLGPTETKNWNGDRKVGGGVNLLTVALDIFRPMVDV